ncbi:pentatricopeptide repeat-containing protein-like [Dorcoceras hygrometricum]|uniref:Pentatricopeptide repeat-containing protein-like n=1 Tax=Dorcoceras hygrometricum TaxID=472368 RepID=A0A2Z7CYY3_9LAMI|nr:pentatricopeptide repeat-containing protein-like [Dorcoceras hygrometricum]
MSFFVAEAEHLDANLDSRGLDLNITAGAAKCMDNDDATSCIREFRKHVASEKEEMKCKDGFSKAKAYNLDLNADEMSSSNNNDPFYPYKNYELLKQREDFESGSSVGPLEENDSTRQYKKIKQNDYVLASYGNMQMPFRVPKARGRKSKKDVHKRKLEIAKKEQIDRFAKAAAPSGLLHGLNPGIINHVRNSKQVHSIIEAVAKFARTESEEFGGQQDDRNKAGISTKVAEMSRSDLNQDEMFSGRKQIQDFRMRPKSMSLTSEVMRVGGGADMGKTRNFARPPAQSSVKNIDDAPFFKSTTSPSVESAKTISLSNEESANSTSVSSLSVKDTADEKQIFVADMTICMISAANVASQWLELLNQDITGRLAALSQSKQRVGDVIQTVLPHLLSREFKANDEKASYTTKESHICNKAAVEAHRERWFKHFEVMDKALSEEERHLESWLKEVKAMQFHCESGLFGSSQLMDPLGNDNSNGKTKTLVQQGLYLEALQLFSKEPSFPVNTSRFTFPSVLKACAYLSRVRYGESLHSKIIKIGLQYDPFITTSLIDMYVKCGWLSSAVNLFDIVSQCEVLAQDVVLWNSIIDGLLKNGIREVGLIHFRRMQVLNVKPDGYTLCILLGSCNHVLDIAYGKEIHAYVMRNAFVDDPFVVTAMIHLYSNFNMPMDAWYVFENLENKCNVAAWNAMINGFCENWYWIDGLKLYTLAKSESLKLGSTTFSSVLTACSQGDDIGSGYQIHCDVVKAGFENDPFVSTSLITFYSKCGFLKGAERVFCMVKDKEVEIWNSMISAYVTDGRANDALLIYNEMRSRMVETNSFTISNTLVACNMVGNSYLGRIIHGELIKKAMMESLTVQSALLTMYSKLGCPKDAHKVFSEMKEKDFVAWGSLMSGTCEDRKFLEVVDLYKAMESDGVKPDPKIIATVIIACTGVNDERLGFCFHGLSIKKGLNLNPFVGSSLVDFYSQLGLPDMAERVFSNVWPRNLVVWNSLMSCYYQNGLPDISISLLSQILQHGLFPDAVSITTVLPAVSSTAGLLKGKAIHGYYIRLQIPEDIQVDNALMGMYIKSGCLNYAQNMFNSMSKRNLVSWNSIIAGFGSHSECHKAIDFFHGMRNSGIEPDGITFLSLISSCNHCGFVEEGLKIFQSMKEHKIEIKMEHYVNMVDLLGRAGRLYDAYNLVKDMTMTPGRGVWLSLLSSCRVHRNVELGEFAARNLIEIDQSRGSNYVQLLNLYIDTGLQGKAAKLRALMREKGLTKIPGCSWIEVKNKVDVFYSGDSSAPSTVLIYETVDNLKNCMNRMDISIEAGDILLEPG